ncbi:protein-methionine-sulfoxide reductase heme-binding subunit MsrQ [Azohydromonas lata]|uniref:Protein-methionine-sulfoxide reductase heme-binding subunit MsrQ n=1 Tax=Azohydromonas lata TaxID=45677 RepID=A0ABU5IF99_9BURK|nr:protein-methionine-sulfoxide reductase heme-binding subunit MsrQ [Azohydromonas lata]MDZ5457789.1 protein-methionine-sulfoxide reductase heme-binding subunit MsrQ [Azohydromonas lata]
MANPAIAAGAARKKPLLLHPASKPLLFALLLLPLAYLVWAAATDSLGANPAEALIRRSGDWTLRLLCATLAITPLRVLLKQPALVRFRRMLGVATFGYAVVHFVCYAVLDQGLDLQVILKDIAKRPFILVGTAALVLMTPLALTSFNRAIKALGGKRWQRLHQSIYAIALLALLHFFWMKAGKNDFTQWSIYAAVIAALLGWRVWEAKKRSSAALLKQPVS